jgi:rhodanese-related sulfurtransferase
MLRAVSVSALLLVMIAGGACSSRVAPASGSAPDAASAQPQATVTKVSPAELADMLAGPRDFTLVNVHTPYEGNLPSTDLSIAYDTIDQHLDELPSKDAKIVLYCRSGRMSNIASQRLAELGYTHVYDLVGGMQAWEASGRTVIR